MVILRRIRQKICLPPRSEYNAALQTDGKIIPAEKICQKEMVGEMRNICVPRDLNSEYFPNPSGKQRRAFQHICTVALKRGKIGKSYLIQNFFGQNIYCQLMSTFLGNPNKHQLRLVLICFDFDDGKSAVSLS